MTVPTFARGVRLRFDKVRDSWVVLAPERLYVLEGPAAEVLQLVDGVRSTADIVDQLAAKYDAPRAIIAGDVQSMLDELATKGAIRP